MSAAAGAAAGPGAGSVADAKAYLDRFSAGRQEPESLSTDILERELERLVPRSMRGGATSGCSSPAAGFGASTRGLLERFAGALAPAGRAQAGDVPATLSPGSAVSAVLVGGDLELAVNGTVTGGTEKRFSRSDIPGSASAHCRCPWRRPRW